MGVVKDSLIESEFTDEPVILVLIRNIFDSVLEIAHAILSYLDIINLP
jgi:hypothetical protein